MFFAIIFIVNSTLPAYASHGYVNARVCYFGGSSDYLEANSWYIYPWTFDLIDVRNFHYKKVSGSWVYIDQGYDQDQTMYQRAHVGHWHSPTSASFKSNGIHRFSHTDSTTIYYKYTQAIDACV